MWAWVSCKTGVYCGHDFAAGNKKGLLKIGAMHEKKKINGWERLLKIGAMHEKQKINE